MLWFCTNTSPRAKEKGQQYAGGQLSGWLEMVPNGGAIISQLQKLKDVAEKKGPEAEQLIKDTMNEIKQVLDQKSKKAEELAESGKQEAKK